MAAGATGSARRDDSKNVPAGRDIGRDAASPTAIPGRGWVQILRRVVTEVGADRVPAVAAGVAFYLLLSIFPFLSALISLYGLVGDPASVTAQLDTVQGMLPDEVLALVGDHMRRLAAKPADSLGLGLIAGVAVALWSANAGMKAMVDALNVAYGESETRGFFLLNALTLLLTLGVMVFFILAVSATVVLPPLLNWAGAGSVWTLAVSVLRWPLLLMVIAGAVAVLYRFGPDRRQPRWRWISIGGTVASLLFIAVSGLFSWYAANLQSYGETYGPLGAVIAVMTWLWISTMVVLVGAELNAEIEHQTARDSTVGPEKPLGQRGARMADTVATGP